MKPGYKQTEVGVVPEDWKVCPLRDITADNGIIRGPFGGSLRKEFFKRSGIKVLEQKNAINKRIDIGCYYIDERRFDLLKRFEAKPGDFIVSCSGTIGCIYQLPELFSKSIINQALLLIRINNSVCAHPYFYYCFVWENTQRRIVNSTQGGAMKNLIGMTEFKETLFPIPNMEEQTRISESLIDIDSLITSLEKLIEKKKLIKQGVMQELLTGKRRLPGFNGEWETKKFGECFLMYYGKPMKESDRSNSSRIPVYGSNGVVGYTSQALTSGPTIIIGRKGAAGLVHHSVTECWPIDTTFYIEFTDRTDSLFYYYLLQLVGLHKIKSDSAVPGINRADAYAVKISVPPQEERYQIAEFLVTLDTELASLTRNLDKYKYLKQAMMQELLTGRIRLI